MDHELKEVKISPEVERKRERKQRDAFRRKFKTENPNVFDPKSKRTVFEKILRTPNSVDDIKWCIKHGADLYACNDNKRYPIMAACDSLDTENVKTLLEFYSKSKINVKFDQKNCLHLLLGIFDNSAKRSEFRKVGECLKLLLEAGCDPNSPDKDNRTPFFLLLRAKPKLDSDTYNSLVHSFMKKPVDVYSFRSDEMKQMLSVQGLPIPAKIEPVINAGFMRSLLDEGRSEEFIEYFEDFKNHVDSADVSNGYDNTASESEETATLVSQRHVHFPNDYAENCAMFLVEAVKNGAANVVEFLLSQGIDINKYPRFEKPAGFLACTRGYNEILELLLNHTNTKGDFDLEVQYKEKNLLHEVCSHFGYAEESKEEDVNQNYQRCFDLLMSCPEIDINQQDEFGFTPLYYAVRYRNDEATKMLLRKCYVGRRNIFHKAQIFHIRKEIFEEFLDECISLDVDKLTGEQKIKVDFNFLVAPEESGQEFFEEIGPLEDIANNTELRPLILHPVLSSFLYLKWIKLSILFYTNLLFFFFFMGSFITYIVLYKSDVLFAFSLISLILMISKEIMQCFLSYKNYFKSCMNWFEMALIVLIWIVLLDNQFKSVHDTFTEIIGMKTLRIIRAVTILSCSYEFLILFGDLPNFAVSTHMVILKRVFITFLKSIALYSILLVGFAFCFFTLFNYEHDSTLGPNTNATTREEDDEAFHNFRYPGFAIIKTIVMFSGELEASNLNLRNNDAFYSIIFLLFVFLVTIVLLNLINGLSVSDVFQIKAEGHLVDLCQKIHVLNKYERIIMSRSTSFRFLKSIVSIFPEFVQNGKIEIDTNSHKVKLNSSALHQESFFDHFYHQALKQVIKFDSVLKRGRDKKVDSDPKPQPGTFAIKIDGNIMKKIKFVLEERVEKKNQVDHHGRILNIEARLQVLAKMDEKLQKIMNVLDENF